MIGEIVSWLYDICIELIKQVSWLDITSGALLIPAIPFNPDLPSVALQYYSIIVFIVEMDN